MEEVRNFVAAASAWKKQPFLNHHRDDYASMVMVTMAAWVVAHVVGRFCKKKTSTTTTTKPKTPGDGTANTTQRVELMDGSLVVQSDLWAIHGELYNLHDFVKQHLGGYEAIMLGRGRDATRLFDSYHAFADQNKVRAILKKYKVTDTTRASPPPPAPPSDPFYHLLIERARRALEEAGMDPIRDRGASWTRTATYIAVLIALVLSGMAHTQGYLLGSLSLGVFGWLAGGIGHDGGHFSVSHHVPVLNEYAVWCIGFLANPLIWQQQHTYGHHSYTNEFDRDPDLHHFIAAARLHPRHPHKPIYRGQIYRIYVLFVYSLICMGQCLLIPLRSAMQGSLCDCVEITDFKRPMRVLAYMMHFVVYVSWIVIWPFFVQETRWRAVASIALQMGTVGLSFGLCSQINHINEASIMAAKNESTRKEAAEKAAKTSTAEKDKDPIRSSLVTSWAKDQVETSNDFCIDSTFWFLASNGLNMQIEHHLFPSLNHCHLHIVQPVVEATCCEYGVNYKSFKTWDEVFDATLLHLSNLAGLLPGEKKKAKTKNFLVELFSQRKLANS